MSLEVNIHAAQTQILRELLFVESAGFAVLQKPTGLTSDHFKFHIKRLVELGYVEKAKAGHYRLSTIGKEYANKIDTDNRTIERQPKCAVILVIEKVEKGTTYFIVQERRKHPYFGFWGFPTGKIRWGETIMQTAARELAEETGLQATLTYRGIYHEHMLEQESGVMLEDKIFHVIYGSDPQGELMQAFDSGRNIWTTLDKALSFKKRYDSFDTEVAIGLGRETFVESTYRISHKQF